MVRILAVSDLVDEGLRADQVRATGADLVAGCGDLPFDYLGWLGTALDVPVLFVPGNHDPDVSGYRRTRSGLVLRAGIPTVPPWPDGAHNLDGRVMEIAGLRIAGLGGCLRYRDGPNQYTQRQQARRARKLVRRSRWRRGRGRPIDVILAHAPPMGIRDGPDEAHKGFEALRRLMSAFQPRFVLHGHVDPSPGARATRVGATRVVNVTGHLVLDIGATGSRGEPRGDDADRTGAVRSEGG